MSRIGKLPVTVPGGVEITVSDGNLVTVKGPKGTLQEQISEKMQDVREQVLENFDIGVQERLKLAKSETGAFLNRYEHIFWELTKYILGEKAAFDDAHHAFRLLSPVAGCRTGKYELLSCVTDGIPYRLSHPLAQYVLQTALSIPTKDGAITFRENELALKVTLPDYLKLQQIRDFEI